MNAVYPLTAVALYDRCFRQEVALDFKTIIILWIVRIVEVLFFAGIAGCLVTIALSWYSIFRDEFFPKN